jgi:sugar/nucleoside kinase (ribokinase family)
VLLLSLIKVLDIGGRALRPNFQSTKDRAEEEVPPIPAHVHNGYICRGCACGHGKLEAYFFPPLPKNTTPFIAKTRLGVLPGTEKDKLVQCMDCFGMNDTMYEHLNVFTIESFTGWTIECGVIHAPGPYPTFEVQLPQDDGNLLAWQMGQKIQNQEQRQEEVIRSMLKSTTIDTSELYDQVVNHNKTSDPQFEEKFHHPSTIIEKGAWGSRRQTFFKRFYGEAIEVMPGQKYTLASNKKPCSMVVWSGSGTVNGHEVKDEDSTVMPLPLMKRREMLIVPNTTVVITANANANIPLLLLSVYPFQPAVLKRNGIACCGLSCVDYVIQQCDELKTPTDHVFAEGYQKRCGGSVYNTSRSLQFVAASTCRIEALTLVGEDEDGDYLLAALKKNNIGIKYVARTNQANTQVAFLPVYKQTGERACIVVPGTTSLLDASSLLDEVGRGCQRIDLLRELLWMTLGYPFELPKLQGSALNRCLTRVRHPSVNVAVAVDLNGAASSLIKNEDRWSIISSALPNICFVHMNWEEAVALHVGASSSASSTASTTPFSADQIKIDTVTEAQLNFLAQPFVDAGVAIVTITLGRYGAFIRVHSDVQHVCSQFGVAKPDVCYVEEWCHTSSVFAKLPTMEGEVVDTVGAGDSFLAGMLAGLESMASIHTDDENKKESNNSNLLNENAKTLNGLLDFGQQCAGRMIRGLKC